MCRLENNAGRSRPHAEVMGGNVEGEDMPTGCANGKVVAITTMNEEVVPRLPTRSHVVSTTTRGAGTKLCHASRGNDDGWGTTRLQFGDKIADDVPWGYTNFVCNAMHASTASHRVARADVVAERFRTLRSGRWGRLPIFSSERGESTRVELPIVAVNLPIEGISPDIRCGTDVARRRCNTVRVDEVPCFPQLDHEARGARGDVGEDMGNHFVILARASGCDGCGAWVGRTQQPYIEL